MTSKEKDKDKEGRRIVWIYLSQYTLSETTKMFKEFIVYHYERFDSQKSHDGWAQMVDPTDAGLQNVNLEWKLFLMTVLQ